LILPSRCEGLPIVVVEAIDRLLRAGGHCVVRISLAARANGGSNPRDRPARGRGSAEQQLPAPAAGRCAVPSALRRSVGRKEQRRPCAADARVPGEHRVCVPSADAGRDPFASTRIYRLYHPA
jgi:hypothetical protein